ncbi:MAG: thiolase family protein [Vulcanimicrobiaceae bacterium]|jgi:acetyl-CoA C-acetyltransferase/3-oxo-5,6-didehydrosuberyl-CoA/3-oxoadipyl-CoA thiolase
MIECVVVDAVRTPIGRYGGALSMVRPDDLSAIAIKGLLARNPIDPSLIEDVYWGAANQAGEDCRNVARMAVLLAGLPTTVAGTTLNRLCGSSLQALNSAAHAVMVGAEEIVIAGGAESMSRAPFVLLKAERAFDRAPEIADSTLGNRLTNPRLAEVYPPIAMGETAENVADKFGISREAQDEFALRSQQRCAKAMESGRFESQLIPVAIKNGKTDAIFDVDEHPRPKTTIEDLRKLKPAFRPGGTVTAGNSSGLNDGAAALLLMSAKAAKKHGLEPMARIVTTGVYGVDPSIMGIGPIGATQRVLSNADLTIDDIDLVELNEAFAAQSLACIQELRIDPEKVNVNGGAIALGHPLGCSGARIATTLLHELNKRDGRYAIATMCIGMGQGIATLFERG